MRKYLITIITAASLLQSADSFAGNKDRSGQAAASELLINPWAATGGNFGMNGANVGGLEAMKLNCAGLAKTKNFELGFAHNTYLVNSGVQIVNAGAAFSLSGNSKLGVNLMSVNYGNIPITTVGTPQGIGTEFKPSFTNISLGYAYSFGRNIDAGINLTFVNESVTNARASAVGIDAGIMYTTGFKDELHFGVTLKNVGTNVRFQGDGLSFSSTSIDDQDKFITVSQRSEKFQLPTQLGISTSYDIYLGKKIEGVAVVDTTIENGDANKVAKLSEKSNTRLTLMGSFISNAFINDYLGAGAEFAFRERFFIRAGYRYESGVTNIEKRTTLFTGVAVGAGLNFKLDKDGGRKVQLDYAFKPTFYMGPVHTVSLRLFN
jgi:opacity protein-like surface antigen